MRPRLAARPLAALAALALAGACGGDGAAPAAAEEALAGRRVLVVGWDGATFDLLDPLMAEGRLPHLAALAERGATATLASTIVPISSAAWTSAATGRWPGETGVYSFFEPVAPGAYDVRLVDARSSRAPPVWRVLTARGVPVVVFGVPLTYPPEPVLGTLVAGMLSPEDADYAWPPGTADRLRARGFVPDLGVWRERRTLTQDRIDEQLRIKEEVLVELLEDDAWRFAMVVFKSLDVLSHRAYDGSTAGEVARLCEQLDAVLGRLVEAAGPGCDVLVVSDHGFASYPAVANLHQWLVEAGFAALRGGPRRAPRLAGPLADALADEHDARLGELDLARTRAFAGVAEGNFGTIRLNVVGREPEGAVAPEDVDALLAELETALLAWRAPGRATPVVRRVLRARELYPGPHAELLPDLLVEAAPDVRTTAAIAPLSYAAAPRPQPHHALEGILVAAGPRVARVAERRRAEVVDVAPTALHLLGLPVLAEMDGAPPAWLLARPAAPRVVPTASIEGLGGAGAPSERPYTPAEVEELEERLRALGYVE